MHCPSSKNVNSNSEYHKTKAHLPHNRHFYVLEIYLITNDPIDCWLELFYMKVMFQYQGQYMVSLYHCQR